MKVIYDFVKNINLLKIELKIDNTIKMKIQKKKYMLHRGHAHL